MTNIEFIEKQVARLESLIEVAKKCCDESLVREAEKKIEKNKQVIADLKKLEMFETNYETTVKRNKELIEENEKLKQAIEILKRYVAISKRKNEVNGNYDISCMYSFGSYKDITQQDYELLKEVLENGVD